jgi:signal transduction histidine kinase
MKRTLASIGLAAIAAGVLVFLALASRPLPASVHIAQNSLQSELGIVEQDYFALLAAFEAAWSSRQPPGEAAQTLVKRLQGTPTRIADAVAAIPGSRGQRNFIDTSLTSFNASVGAGGQIAAELLGDLSAFSAGVTVLRDFGPAAVQRLRDLRLDGAATRMFELVMGTLDFASDAPAPPQDLRDLVEALERDQSVDANLPREMTALGGAAKTILGSKRSIEDKLGALRATPIIASAQALESAVDDAYRSSMARIDRARLMLAVYAMLLLAAVTLITYRLKQSYRAVAAANGELSRLNESLEHRVLERTEALEGTLRDLKESQVQLVQAEKMSSLGQLVAGISHEINTPLLYLANNIELIQERLGNLRDFLRRSLAVYTLRPDDFDARADYQRALANAMNELRSRLEETELDADLEEAQDLLGDCADGLKDLTDMAQSLKDFSRLDRAPVAHFDVNTGLDKTLVIARNMVKHKANLTKCYGEVPEIECSPSQINQVFLNLISNAAQAIDDKGEIALKTALYDADHIAVSVSDTGCGIPEEIIDKIKDPFFTTKEVGSGTGLGLSIADEIIRKHGGQLLIESKPGAGSKFTVVLPIKSAARNADPDAEQDCDARPDDPAETTRLAEAS